MNVKPGVPYVKHSNPNIRSDIYSQLLAIPEIKIDIPDTGQVITVLVPGNQQKERSKVKVLLTQIGFDGLKTFNEQTSSEGTRFTVVVE
jgi:hypothetical protein